MSSADERTAWVTRFREKAGELAREARDSAHDLAHFERVAATAERLCHEMGADWNVVAPAAWLHDFVIVPKNDPRRAQASRLAAEAATAWLREIGYPEKHLAAIAHAIEAHSYSAKIEARTLEAKIVQDADRLDGVGAIGVARCFSVGGILARPFYDPADPFAERRPIDDRVYTVDHFYAKLFKTVETLVTEAGRNEGARRAETMRAFLSELKREIAPR